MNQNLNTVSTKINGKKTKISKPIIHNVVITADLQQKIPLHKFIDYSWGTYDFAIYGGRCGYVKTPNMKGRVTVFQSGKMISVGSRSNKEAINQINEAKFCLLHAKIINDLKLKTKIRNIVAVATISNNINLSKIMKLNKAIYDPGRFPGVILKSVRTIRYLIFSSGKVVIVGTKSKKELLEAVFELNQKLSKLV